MLHRRKFLQLGSLGAGTFFSTKIFSAERFSNGKMPLVISTWDAGINANKGAWKVLRNGGRALDAVEQGVMVTESEISCCVGLGAYIRIAMVMLHSMQALWMNMEMLEV